MSLKNGSKPSEPEGAPWPDNVVEGVSGWLLKSDELRAQFGWTKRETGDVKVKHQVLVQRELIAFPNEHVARGWVVHIAIDLNSGVPMAVVFKPKETPKIVIARN